MAEIELKTIETVSNQPFRKLVTTIGELPSAFIESMSYYEMLAWLVNWLENTVIPTVNNNAEAVEELQGLFIELKTFVDNYFDNLDVQEEINNKLDQMVEDGTLQEIITTYIQSNVAWTFDTVADMKQATNLVNGSYAKTLGFHTLNDGGGAIYKITDTGTANEMDVIAIGSTLYASLIIEPIMNVEQFGAYGDGTHDDTAALRESMNCGASTIMFIKDKTYMLNPYDPTDHHGIIVPSNTTIDLGGATVQAIANDKTGYNMFFFSDCHNSTLKNGKIIGDVETHTGATGEWGYGVSILYSTNITLENLYIAKCWGDGININFKTEEQFDSNNITIRECICDSNRRQGMSIEAGNNIYVENCQFINTGQILLTAPGAGVDIEPLIASKELKNIKFYNCTFRNNKGIQLVGSGNSSIKVEGVVVDHCNIQVDSSTYGWSLWLAKMYDIRVTNCNIGNKYVVYLNPYKDVLFADNYVEASQINIRTKNCTNGTLLFKNNTFKSPDGIASNVGLFQNYDTGTRNTINTKYILSGNTFICKTTGTGNEVEDSAINLMHQEGADFAIIEDNIVIGSKNGMKLTTNCIVRNNVVMGTTIYGMNLFTTTVSGVEVSYDIENNVFQNCGSNTSVIWDYYAKNIVLKNNIYYPYYFYSGIGTTDYAKTTFMSNMNPTGYSLVADNQVFTS